MGTSGTILRTTDGGGAWTAQSSGTTQDLTGVFFTDSYTGTAVGYDGTILRTFFDGGAHCTPQSSGTKAPLSSVVSTDKYTGTAAGSTDVYGGQAEAVILHTTNGGKTWIKQSPNTTEYLMGVSFVDANTGWAVGYQGTIQRTMDGGTTWAQQSSGAPGQLYAIFFSDANNGTAIEESAYWSNSTILRTADGGMTWTPPPGQTYPSSMESSSLTPTREQAVGDGDTIMRTTDGGNTWITQQSIGERKLRRRHREGRSGPPRHTLLSQRHVCALDSRLSGRDRARRVDELRS